VTSPVKGTFNSNQKLGQEKWSDLPLLGEQKQLLTSRLNQQIQLKTKHMETNPLILQPSWPLFDTEDPLTWCKI
jgi:hypothetical protein